MRTLKFLTTLGLAAVVSATAADGQLELKHHRFSKQGAKKFERLVLEFSRAGGGGSPNVRVAADGTAGEVTIHVTDVSVKGALPETAINDSYVSKSALLGPLSVAADNAKGGLTLRTLLKNPQAKVDAFWLTNPARLVIDAFTADSPRSAGLAAVHRTVAGKPRRRGSVTPRYTNRDFICFPASTAVGMKVQFNQPTGNGRSMPVAVEGAPRAAEASSDAVVCYPKHAQVAPSIAFDLPSTPPVVHNETPAEPSTATNEPAESSASAEPSASSAPANTIHKKSPFAESGNAPKALAMPSAETKPAAPVLPPAEKKEEKPALGLQLPTGAPPPSSERGPTSANGKPTPLTLTLPSLPNAPGANPRLAPPPSQAPSLLPPLAK